MNRKRSQLIKDSLLESNLFRSRAIFSIFVVLAFLLTIVGRFTYLQVFKHEEFVVKSEANRIKIKALPPNRGLIYDRHGVLLADNQPAYRLQVIPEQTEALNESLQALRDIVDLDDDDIKRFRSLKRARPSFSAIPLKLRLTEDQVARFAVQRHRFPGIDIEPYQNRVYPFGEAFAHVLGYVGRLGPEDLANLDEGNYAASTHIGKIGIERSQESRLHGQIGHEQVETNAQGRVLTVLEREPPRSGEDLFLTLDANLQLAATAALDDYTGAIVAVEPGSGDVLAMVSMPSFDPNLFVNGVSHKDYNALINSPARPLFNRALHGGYEPGSTIKPFVGLAGLELGVIPPNHTVVSNGFYQIPGQQRRYRDWKAGGHGEVDIVQAIGQSVNIFFYQLAYTMGIDPLHDYLQQFGFGQATGIDLIGEAKGILPSRAWKRSVYNQPWYPGETVISGIGQGFTVTTPLQLAHATAILGSRGQVQPLNLVLQESPLATSDLTSRVPIKDSGHWELIIDGMEEVVHGKKGTARAIVDGEIPFRIAGKSGTAQVYGLAEGEEYNEDDVPRHLRDHALFIAIAPADDPQIVVAVVAEHGGSGSRVAAPMARKVIDAFLHIPASDAEAPAP